MSDVSYILLAAIAATLGLIAAYAIAKLASLQLRTTSGETVWVVAQVKSTLPDPMRFEIEGVYSSRDRAVSACQDEWDCVFSARVDHSFGRETVAVGEYPLNPNR